MFLGATAGRAVGADAVRVVHHRDDAVAEAALVGRRRRQESVSGAASPRMLKMPSKMTTTRHAGRHGVEAPGEVGDVVVAEDRTLLLGTLAMRIARMMQLWFSSSPIQYVSGPHSVMAVPSTVV